MGPDSEDTFDPGAGGRGKLEVVQFGTIFRKTRNVAFREQKVVWKKDLSYVFLNLMGQVNTN